MKDEKTYKKWTRELATKPVQKVWSQGELIEGNSKTVPAKPAKADATAPAGEKKEKKQYKSKTGKSGVTFSSNKK